MSYPSPVASPLAPPTRPLSPGEINAVLLVGGCVAGRSSALEVAITIAIPVEYVGGDTMAAVIEACTDMFCQWGAVDTHGATQGAWDWVLSERLDAIEEGHDCAEYCLQYLKDFEAAQGETGE